MNWLPPFHKYVSGDSDFTYLNRNNWGKGVLVKDSDLQQLEYENLIKNIKGFAGGGRAGFKVGSLRKGIQALIDKSVKSTPKDTTPELDKLIKKTLDEDFFDKKDRIIDNINAKIARARAKGLDSEETNIVVKICDLAGIVMNKTGFAQTFQQKEINACCLSIS